MLILVETLNEILELHNVRMFFLVQIIKTVRILTRRATRNIILMTNSKAMIWDVFDAKVMHAWYCMLRASGSIDYTTEAKFGHLRVLNRHFSTSWAPTELKF